MLMARINQSIIDIKKEIGEVRFLTWLENLFVSFFQCVSMRRKARFRCNHQLRYTSQ